MAGRWDLLRAPGPSERIRKQHSLMVRAVTTVAEDESEVVAGLGQGRADPQAFGQPVVGGLVPVEVAVGRLEEDP